MATAGERREARRAERADDLQEVRGVVGRSDASQAGPAAAEDQVVAGPLAGVDAEHPAASHTSGLNQ